MAIADQVTGDSGKAGVEARVAQMVPEERHGRGGIDVTARPKVSVAMTTYNGERFIEEQLASLAQQSRLPDELVVSDDGSQDGTLERVRAFAAQAPFPVRILCGSRSRGVLDNFDRVIASCQGDIVFPCDQDDVWLPQKLAEMTEALARHPSAGMVISNSELVDEHLCPTGRNLYTRRLRGTEHLYARGREAVRLVLASGLVFGHTMAFRSLPLLMRPAALVTTQSAYDVIRVLLAASFFDLVVIPHALTRYRRHESQVTPAQDVSPGPVERIRQLVAGYQWQAATNARFAGNLLQISAELETLGAEEDVIRFLQGKIRMATVQEALPPSRLRRVLPVASNLMSGRYHLYANGISTALRHLLMVVPRSSAQ
ncbi:MAG TPA: glycosyltransferase [Acetobacteraceae bacterium]|nr:glycosyltransferase [Acetobacteraceae bacterium]